MLKGSNSQIVMTITAGIAQSRLKSQSTGWPPIFRKPKLIRPKSLA